MKLSAVVARIADRTGLDVMRRQDFRVFGAGTLDGTIRIMMDETAACRVLPSQHVGRDHDISSINRTWTDNVARIKLCVGKRSAQTEG